MSRQRKQRKNRRQEEREWMEHLMQVKNKALAEAREEIPKYERHPYARFVPPMTPQESKALCEDIKTNGLKDDITLYEGMILDGQERYDVCWQAGIKPRFRYLTDDEDPFSFIKRKNKPWRNLNNSRRAICAAKEYMMRKNKKPPIGGKTVEEISREWKSAKRSVERVLAVLPKIATELSKALEEGRVTLHWVEKVSECTHQEQAEKLYERQDAWGRAKAKNPLAVLDPVTRIEINLTSSQMKVTQEHMASVGCKDMRVFVLQTYLQAIGIDKGL